MSDIQVATCTNFSQVGPDNAAGAAGQAIAVIDCGVFGWQSLRDALPAGIETILIQPGQDGLAAMVEGLSGRHGIAALHILSHGFAGGMQLGSTTLDRAALPARQAELATIGASLAADGDILIYSCSVASGGGEAFLEELAAITGADLAASRSLTGAAELGGDWDLDWTHGVVATQALRIEEYRGVLSSTLAPSFFSSTGYIGEQFVTLAFGSDLDAANPPLGSAFEILVNGVPATVSTAEIIGRTVRITLDSGVLMPGDVIDVTYFDPTFGDDANAIQGMLGEDTESFDSSITVTSIRPPGLQASEVNGQFVTLTYSGPLASLPTASVSDFLVVVDGDAATVNSLLVDGPAGKVTLVLDVPVQPGQSVNLLYGDPTDMNDIYAIQGADGVDTASTIVPVANVTVVPDGSTPPVATANAIQPALTAR